MDKKRLFLIDGNSFCYRAFYAIRELANSKGFPTNAVYGFVSMLKKIIESEQPEFLAIAFDLKGPTFRHEKYEAYKLHRKPMPESLAAQIPVIKDIVRAYRIPIYEKQGFEADDIIGTISLRADKNGIMTLIVTGDKDALQLVSKNTRVYSTHKEGVIYDEDAVISRFGVGPKHVVDIMALMGDSSDNIPGVPGIGEKTAVDLLAEFKTVDNLIKNADKIKSRSKASLIKENIDKIYLSRELAEIDRMVDIDIDFEAMRTTQPDAQALFALFSELEFRKLAEEFSPKRQPEGAYSVISSEDEFGLLLESLKKDKLWAFDFETTSTDPMDCEIVGVSFCRAAGKADYVSFVGDGWPVSQKQFVLDNLKTVFENHSIKKIGQNIKYECVLLRNLGINLKGIFFDTMVASYLLNPSKPNHNLSDIAMEHLGLTMTDISELIGKGKTKITMAQVPLDSIARYCCQDSDVTFRLKEVLEEKLERKSLDGLFRDIELPLIEVLSDMEFHGVKIDTSFLVSMSKSLRERLDDLTRRIYESAGCEFNINSPKQLGHVLFEKLALPVIKKTKTGVSTDSDVLSALSVNYDLPKIVLEYREFSKLVSTYIDALPRLVNGRTKKVHTSFNQTVTATGRLSSSDPNLQNIPVRTDIGKKIRGAFKPSFENGIILSADYSQIELRILAHLSMDNTLVEAFINGMDIHRYTASLIFDRPAREIDDTMRNQAKTVNFGIIYGMSPYGLSKELGIPVDTAKGFIDAYFSRYPGVREFMLSQIEFARENGYVLTMFNRRRYIPEISSENQNVRQFAERTAVNTPIQGTAADMIKIAMINVSNKLKAADLKTKMILQVHDELVFDMPKPELEKASSIIKESMEGVVKLKVPIKVNVANGKSWQDA
ncbi:MAG: DNA polymerase I [Candidatus Omnitrophica bacterium]|nr:DNA polymerase I [Candidatus Omnitrophota bacterium]